MPLLVIFTEAEASKAEMTGVSSCMWYYGQGQLQALSHITSKGVLGRVKPCPFSHVRAAISQSCRPATAQGFSE